MSKEKNTKGLGTVLFLGIMAAMAPLATDMYLPALPELQGEFGSSTATIQLTLTMTMLGMALGQIFAGPISDLKGRKKPLFCGMVIFMLASLVCATISDIRIFLVARFIQGLAGSCGIVIARAIARDICSGAELTSFYAILMMVNGLAPILAPVLGGQIMIFSDWRGVFLVLTMIGLIMALATLAFKETLPATNRIHSIKSCLSNFPILLRDKYFLGHCLVQSFVFISFFCYIGSSSFVFQGIYQVTAQEYSFMFGGIGVGLMITGIIPAKLAGRIPEYVLMKYALIVPVFSCILLVLSFLFYSPLWLVFVLMLISAVPISVLGATSFSLALSKQKGSNAGSASAILGFSSMFLGGLMMPVAGFFGTDTGVPMAIIMAGGFIIALICFKIYIWPEHQLQD